MVLLLATALGGRAVAAPISSPNDPSLGAGAVHVDFEGSLPGTYPAYAGGLSVPTPAGIVNLTAARLEITGTYAGQYNSRGSQYLSSEGYLFRNLIITFPTPVHAFGMNIGLTDQPWELYAYDTAGSIIEMVSIPPTFGSNAGDFFGIASVTPIASAVLVVQVPVQPGPLWVLVDELAFSAPLAGLAVTKEGHGDGAVVSTPAGIDCGATCAASLAVGETVTLTATPASGSFFGGWGGDCSGTEVVTAMALTGDAHCSAAFHLVTESADLRVEMSKAPTTARAGRRLLYRAAIANRGPSTAVAASVALELTGLQGADMGSVKVSKDCSVTGTTINCALGDVVRGRRKVITVAVVCPAPPGRSVSERWRPVSRRIRPPATPPSP